VNDIDSGKGLTAGVALTFISMAAFLVLPLYVGAAAEAFALGPLQLGLLASLVGGGSALSSVAMMLLVRRVPWRAAGAVTLSLMLVPMTLSMWVDSAGLFFALQAIAATGSGSTYSLALTALSDRRHPGRAFGLSVAAQVSFQVAGMLALPRLISLGGMDGVLALFVALEILGLAFLAWLPKQGRVITRSSTSLGLPGPALWCALAGCFFFFFNVGAVWTYIERMAVLAGIGPAQIGAGLAAGVAFGIPGALLASRCGERFGSLGPLALGAVGTVAAVWLLGMELSLATYVTAAALYNFVWNFSLPFQYQAVNNVDPSGSGVAAAPAFHGAGVAFGPGLTALYVTETDLSAVNWVAAVTVLISLALFAMAFFGHRRAAGTGQKIGTSDG
jgi:predicted MFS family arabinose efflux permease